MQANLLTETFLQTLNVRVPGWASLNLDSNWLAWLSGKDRYGRLRANLLEEAMKSLDADSAVALITDFQATQQVPPRTSTRPQQEEGVKRSFIRDFYQDVSRGRYRGKEKEKLAIQVKIDKAISSGRVLNG